MGLFRSAPTQAHRTGEHWALAYCQLSLACIAASEPEDAEMRPPGEPCAQKQDGKVYHPPAGETTLAGLAVVQIGAFGTGSFALSAPHLIE